MAWDNDLTDEQRAAASHAGTHSRLLAGPGTGKTLSMARRIVYLISEKKIEPSKILALTFTRAAAAELKERVKNELSDSTAILPHISTLHSFALKTILKNSAGTQLPQPVRIADDYEERWIIQEDLKRNLKMTHVNDVAKLLNQISADWEQLKADIKDWEKRFPNPKFLGAWKEHRKIYGYTLRAELVYQLKLALSESGLEFDNVPDHLLVDEYQDLNACDLAVIREISKRGAELFCAGDDDQSIYGFRYADPEGIRRFDKEYSPHNLMELTLCKRCSKRILDLALYVARQDYQRLDKQLHPDPSSDQGEVRILRFKDQNEEAYGIAQICKWLIDKKNTPPENILILLRSDYKGRFSKTISSALATCGLHVAISADPLEPLNCPIGENKKKRVAGRIFLCLLKLLVNSSDHLAWRTILQLRNNSIGSSTFEAIYDLARNEDLTFSQVLQRVKNDPNLVLKGEKIKHEVEEIEKVLSCKNPLNYQDLLSFILSFSENHIADEEERAEVCKVFEQVLTTGEIEDLEELLRAINVSLGNNEQETEKEAINLMTMHQAKGLSADAVFVVAAENEYIPGRTTGQLKSDERRLLYVSITRAKRFLFLTHCLKRTGQQKRTGSNPDSPKRTLSEYLSGGLIKSENGTSFFQGL